MVLRNIFDRLTTIIDFEVDTRGIKTGQKALENAQSTMSRTAVGLAIAGGALVGVGFIIGRTAYEFEQSINLLAAVSQASEGDIRRFREQAYLLGRTTHFTASQVVDAQVAMAQSGASVNDTLVVMPHLLNLARAGQLTMAESAEIVTRTLRPFSLGIEHAERLMNILAFTASSANTTVGEMGPAFRQVAAEAAISNLTLEQTSAALALLRNNARQPGQAGTQFRTVLLALQEQSTLAEEAITSLGLEVEIIKGLTAAGNYESALRLLHDAGLDAAVGQRIFGREAVGAALILAGQADQLDILRRGAESSNGAIMRMADTMGRGLPGAVARLRSSMEGLQLTLSDSGLVGGLEFWINRLRNIIQLLTFLSSGPLGSFVVAAILAGPIVLAFGAALRILAFSFLGLPGPMQRSILLMGVWIKTLFAARAAAISAALATWGLNLSLLPVLAGIAALVAGLYLVTKYWDNIKEFFGFGNGLTGASADTPLVPASIAPGTSGLPAPPGNRTVSVNVGDINVDATGGDSADIAANTRSRIEDEMRVLAYDSDSNILR